LIKITKVSFEVFAIVDDGPLTKNSKEPLIIFIKNQQGNFILFHLLYQIKVENV
jgi:hypothetical protein